MRVERALRIVRRQHRVRAVTVGAQGSLHETFLEERLTVNAVVEGLRG